MLSTWISSSVLLYDLSHLVSCFSLMLSALHLSPCFLPLPYVLCILFFALFFIFALCLIRYVFCLVFYLVSYLSNFRSCLSAVDLLIFSFYIVNLDKQFYIELAANQCKCFVWHYWVFYALRLLPCLLFLPYVLCVASFVSSFACRNFVFIWV